MKFANNSANTNGKAAVLLAYDGPCVFFSLHVHFGGDGGGYVQLFDSRSAPGKGDRPKRVWYITEQLSFDHETTNGIPLQNGCVLVVSDAEFTYAPAATATGIMDVVFYIPPPPAPPKTDPLPEDPALKPSPAPQRPPPASTPAGRPAPTSKPLRGTVAALLVAFLTLCSSGWAASSTTPSGTGGTTTRVAAGTNVTVQTNGSTYTINANASGGTSGVFLSNTLFVSMSGDNATAQKGYEAFPWRDLWVANASAVAGDTIRVGYGLHDQGTNHFQLLPDVNLSGESTWGTWLLGNGNIPVAGPLMASGHRSVISDLSTATYSANNDHHAGWGAANGINVAFTNAVLRRVNIWTDTDGFYVTVSNRCSADFYDCHINSKWDSFLTANNSNHFFRGFKSTLYSDTRGSTNTANTGFAANGLRNGSGVVEWYGGSMIATNGEFDGTYAIFPVVTSIHTNTITRLYGVHLAAAGTNDSARIGTQTAPFSYVYEYPEEDVFAAGARVRDGLNVGGLTNPGTGAISAATITLRSLPGSGPFVALDDSGGALRTHGVSQSANVANLSKYIASIPVFFSNSWRNASVSFPGFDNTRMLRDWQHVFIEGLVNNSGGASPAAGTMIFLPWGFRADGDTAVGPLPYTTATGFAGNGYLTGASVFNNEAAFASLVWVPLKACFSSTPYFLAVRNPLDSTNTFLVLPPNLTNATTMVVLFHGLNGNQFESVTQHDNAANAESNSIVSIKGFLTNGWAILSHFGAGNNWGNAASLTAYSNAVIWATNSLLVTNLVFYAGSMGGAPALNLFSQMPSVSRLYAVSPITSLSNAYYGGNATFSNSINSAYSTIAANFTADTASFDPYRLSTNLFGGRRVRFSASAADTTVATNLHAYLWTNKFFTASISVTNSTGDHNDAGQALPADVINFFR